MSSNVSLQSFPRARSPGSGSTPDTPPMSVAHLLPPRRCTEEMWNNALLQCSQTNDHEGLDWLSRHMLSEGSRSDPRVVQVRSPWSAVIDLHRPAAPVLDQKALDGLFQWLKRDGHSVALDLSGQPLGSAEMTEALADMLKNSSRLTSLKLSNCELEEVGIEKVGEAASHNHTLRELHLDNNEWGDKGWSAMASVLKNTPLLELRMNSVELPPSNPIFANFCKALENNTTLNRLAFGDDEELSSEQADRLNQAFEKNTALEHLEMWYRPFPSLPASGAKPAYRGWINNCRLQSVSLRPIRFAKPECDALISVLENDQSRLAYLAFSGGYIVKDVRQALVAAIIKSRNLKKFVVDREAAGLSGDESEAIDRALARNRQLHAAAGRAVLHLWNRTGPGLPADMAIELGEAFENCTTGRTMTSVVEALSRFERASLIHAAVQRGLSSCHCRCARTAGHSARVML
jgi:hypothetical protein